MHVQWVYIQFRRWWREALKQTTTSEGGVCWTDVSYTPPAMPSLGLPPPRHRRCVNDVLDASGAGTTRAAGARRIEAGE